MAKTNNIGLPASPIDGASATATFPQRALAYTKYLACGQENEFLELATLKPFIGNAGGIDDILTRTMAKIQWLRLGNTECGGIFYVPFKDGTAGDFFNHPPPADPVSFVQTMVQTFGAACKDSTFDVSQPPSPYPPPPYQPYPFFTIGSKISEKCLKAQINDVLSQIQEGDSFPGTDKLPCNLGAGGLLGPGPVVQGDWDMRMGLLIRILYLDGLSYGDSGPRPILDTEVRHHLQNDLITVDGGPGPDSYSLTACGDNEKDTGPPRIAKTRIVLRMTSGTRSETFCLGFCGE